MDDRAVVAALVAGDPRGLDGAYRAYADRLYTYCRFLLRDADAAADAVHDTFILAGQRAAQLRDPDRLRPWLYAIARNECLRVMRGRLRQLPLDEAGQLAAPAVDPVSGLGAEQVRELIWAAAAGLNPGDRQVFELSIRHELSAAEVGAVLGVSDSHAHARLSRVRAQLERSIGALLVARTGAADCADLAGLLHGWDGTLTVLLRKRVSRHIESCSICAERRRQQVSPAALFSAYATLPLLAVPPELWPRLVSTSTDAGQAAARGRIDRRAGRFDPVTGFPRPADRRRGRALAAGLAAAVALVLLLGAAVLAPRLGEVDDAARSATVGPPAVAAPTGSAGESGPATPTGPAAASDPAQATESAPAGGPPSAAATTDPPAPLAVRAQARFACTAAAGGYTLTVGAVIDGGVAQSATLTWSTGAGAETSRPPRASPGGLTTGQTGGPPTAPPAGPGGPGGIVAPGGGSTGGPTSGSTSGEVPMRITDDTATAQVPGLTATTVTWQVTVVAADGRRADAGSDGPVANPCPAPG
ncbi:sigma-70 family RNA polymerase sigma factor [Micromonospora sp. NBC_01813]|uniref:sigma-70 family RNA polymerase sigma factor n=1 Tax=Micromonospora sp. NBC_01813 TaxID=2975988 RepID=UPI002DDAC610|nr:sigma-70 family RNA polymerase sigma factor [Micromonospora sp. NBC_01813]WSA11885.1 sigma-70 family RNA polymerase sigma factor [Micromonospora sp. NBC_01813]